MEATGVSYAEVQMLRDRYPGQPAFPFVPGYDIVGRVKALGPGVDARLAGRRVATMTGVGALMPRAHFRKRTGASRQLRDTPAP